MTINLQTAAQVVAIPLKAAVGALSGAALGAFGTIAAPIVAVASAGDAVLELAKGKSDLAAEAGKMAGLSVLFCGAAVGLSYVSGMDIVSSATSVGAIVGVGYGAVSGIADLTI